MTNADLTFLNKSSVFIAGHNHMNTVRSGWIRTTFWHRNTTCIPSNKSFNDKNTPDKKRSNKAVSGREDYGAICNRQHELPWKQAIATYTLQRDPLRWIHGDSFLLGFHLLFTILISPYFYNSLYNVIPYTSLVFNILLWETLYRETFL